MQLNNLPSDYLYRSKSSKVCHATFGGFGENWGYLYDLIFSSLLYLNKGPIRVLELGVSFFGEGSGHAFSQMPWIEKYVGVDFYPLSSPILNDHVFIQENVDTQKCIQKVSQYAPFDLMIHDADHMPETQIFFLREYAHLLKRPGIMLVENVIKPETVLGRVNDSSLCLIDVPPRLGWQTKGILKINF